MNANTQVRRDRARSGPTPLALTLLDSAKHELAAGMRDAAAASKRTAAHLAALQAASAVVADRSHPPTSRRTKRPKNIWEVLARVEPALGEWAAYFAATARKGASAKRGQRRAVSLREADALLRDAETFVSLAADTLKASAQPVPPISQFTPSESSPESEA